MKRRGQRECTNFCKWNAPEDTTELQISDNNDMLPLWYLVRSARRLIWRWSKKKKTKENQAENRWQQWRDSSNIKLAAQCALRDYHGSEFLKLYYYWINKFWHPYKPSPKVSDIRFIALLELCWCHVPRRSWTKIRCRVNGPLYDDSQSDKVSVKSTKEILAPSVTIVAFNHIRILFVEFSTPVSESVTILRLLWMKTSGKHTRKFRLYFRLFRVNCRSIGTLPITLSSD